MAISRSRIPSSFVRPIVQQHIEYMYENEMGEITRQGKAIGFSSPEAEWNITSTNKYSAIEALAFRAQIKEDTLRRFLSGRSQTIEFAIADKLLCAMHAVQLWMEWPLLPFYLAIPLGDPICGHKACGQAFVARVEGQKYCSKECKRRASNARYRRKHRSHCLRLHREHMRRFRAANPELRKTEEARSRQRQREAVAA